MTNAKAPERIPHCTGCGEYPGDGVADTIDALAKERNELKADIVRYRARLLDDLKSAEKAEAEVERLRAVLSEYKDSLCEGFCGEDQWADAGHCHPDMQRDCGGCKAACALQRKEGNE